MKGTFSRASYMLAVCALLGLTGALPAKAQVRVSVFSGFTPAGGGAPYSGFAGSFISPAVDFATSTGYAWHPFGLDEFGADVTGCITLPTTATVTFGLNSDDGALFFLNGNLNVNNGDPHPPQFAAGSPVTLTGGVPYPFEIQFFECCGGPSGVDLLIDTGSGFQLAPASIFVTTPLTISGASTNPSVLWPPNHKLVDVTVNYTVSGGCGPTDCVLSATSNEPDNGLGDGDTAGDIQIVDAHHVRLRAERSGAGSGRVYTITITCTSASGSSSRQTVNVTVPHDQKK